MKKILIANIPFFVLVFFLAFFVFINGVNGEFVSDDIAAIVNNPHIGVLDPRSPDFRFWYLPHAIIYNLFGPTPVPYHLLSMVYHFINLVLFFLIAQKVFGNKAASISTLLFAVHPLVSEPLLWISASPYLLNSIYSSTLLLLYIKYKETKNKKFLWMVFTFYAFILLPGSAWVMTISGFILVFDQLLIEKEINFKKLGPPLVLIALALLSAVKLATTTTKIPYRLQEVSGTEPYVNRFFYSTYMVTKLLVFPKDLSLYHEGNIITKTHFTIMIVVSVLVVGTTLYLLKKKNKIGALILLGFVSIAPVYSPVQISWFVAERYLYKFAGLFCIILALLFLRIKNKKVMGGLVVVLFCIYSTRTFVRTFDWKTRKSLWHSTQKIAPYSRRVYNNLGDVYSKEGNYPEAAKYFLQAIKIDPSYSEAMHNLGLVYLEMDDLENAEILFKRSIQVNPNLYQSYLQLGIIEAQRENYDSARVYFEKTLEINPNEASTQQLLNQLSR
ncbi:tetratricopeptide repeat protein [Patescibacteria group bacterium]